MLKKWNVFCGVIALVSPCAWAECDRAVMSCPEVQEGPSAPAPSNYVSCRPGDDCGGGSANKPAAKPANAGHGNKKSLTKGIEGSVMSDAMGQTRNYYLSQSCHKKSGGDGNSALQSDDPIEDKDEGGEDGYDAGGSVDPCVHLDKSADGISSETELQKKRTNSGAKRKDYQAFYGCLAGLDKEKLKDNSAFEKSSRSCLQGTKLTAREVYLNEEGSKSPVSDEKAAELASQAERDQAAMKGSLDSGSSQSHPDKDPSSLSVTNESADRGTGGSSGTDEPSSSQGTLDRMNATPPVDLNGVAERAAPSQIEDANKRNSW